MVCVSRMGCVIMSCVFWHAGHCVLVSVCGWEGVLELDLAVELAVVVVGFSDILVV